MNIPNPFEQRRLIGRVWKVSGSTLTLSASTAFNSNDALLFGKRFGLGRVGEYVVVEDGELAVIGRIVSVAADGAEEAPANQGLRSTHATPYASVQILTSLNLADSEVTTGLPRYPRLNSHVYSLSPDILQFLVENYKAPKSDEEALLLHLNLATLPEHPGVTVRLSPEQILGRHCAILGSTGGGKSWTMTRLIEETAKFTSKMILIDATGEYTLSGASVRSIAIGSASSEPSIEAVDLPYTELTEQDLVAIFQPSSKSQLPKFREAIRSLKLAKAVGTHAKIRDGFLIKANTKKKVIHDLFKTHAVAVYDPKLNWDISLLSGQIEHECLYTNANYNKDDTAWGDPSPSEIGYCSTLIARIESYLQDKDFNCIFKPSDRPSVFSHIVTFLKDPALSVLRISLRDLSFAFQIREIIANALGRYLLREARDGVFETVPLVVCVDEAHQFLSRVIGDEDNRYALDSFELIAKEGRKYSLNICLATQRPRDIPEGVLSQIGTFIVHRLTNHHDREVVERACGDMDKSATSFLPTLPEGHALIVGVDFPLPLPVRIKVPDSPPNSRSAQYSKLWEQRTKEELRQENKQSPSSQEDAISEPEVELPLEITERQIDRTVIDYEAVAIEEENEDDLPF